MNKCDIKTQQEAYNTGVKALKEAHLVTGDLTKSLKFAILEIQKNHPDVDFEVSSFTDPIIETLKEKGFADKDYKFNAKTKSSSSEKENAAKKKKIEKVVERFSKLDDTKKSKLARDLFYDLDEKGMLTQDDVLNEYAKVMGYPHMTDEIKDIITETSSSMKKLESVEAEIEALSGEYSEAKKAGTADEKEYATKAKKLVSDYTKAQNEAKKTAQKLSNQLKDNQWFIHDLANMLNMNIMGIPSLIRNLTSAAIDTLPRQVINAISSASTNAIEKIILKPLGKSPETSIPIGSRLSGGTKGVPGTIRKALETFKSGQEGFGKEIRGYDYLSAANEFRDMKKSKGAAYVLKGLAGVLKAPPDFIRRVLGSTDMLFYDPVMQGELNRIAKSKNLDEVETILFMNNPDADSLKIAEDRAKKITLKDDMPISKMNDLLKALDFDSRALANAAVKMGANPYLANYGYGIAKLLKTMVIPFVKTPINIWRLANRYVLPEYTIARSLLDYANSNMSSSERRRELTEGIVTGAVGFHLRNVAIQMVAQGLISAGYGDDDEAIREAIEKKAGGQNRINYDAFLRLLFFGDGKEKASDSYVNLNAIGLMGIVMGAYAHAFNGLSKEEKDALVEKNTLHPSTGATAGFNSFAAILDNTFLSGINQVFEALKEPGKKGQRLAINEMSVLLTSIYPATLQKISQTSEVSRKKIFDPKLEFSENLHNMLGYNFLYDSEDLKDKYSPYVDATGSIDKKRDYALFDNHVGRLASELFDVFKSKPSNAGTPIDILVQEARKEEAKERDKFFPTALKQTVEYKNEGVKYKTPLSEDQFKYYQEMASVHRMLRVTPRLYSEEFKKLSADNKIKVLKKEYEEGRKEALSDLLKKYPDLLNEKNEKKTSENDELEEYYQNNPEVE